MKNRLLLLEDPGSRCRDIWSSRWYRNVAENSNKEIIAKQQGEYSKEKGVELV